MARLPSGRITTTRKRCALISFRILRVFSSMS
jgi:hypothetical protein